MSKKTANQNQSTDQRDEISILKDRLARALADYQNLEARTARESSNLIKFANTSILEKLLEVRDHLGMAAAAGDKTLAMVLSTFDKVLTSEGVTTIKTSGSFDPTLMECEETADGAKDQIIKTNRLGYMLHDRVLRPARVVVGNGIVN